MANESKTPYGNIRISDQAIIELASEAAETCYGVVELVNPSPLSIVKKEDPSSEKKVKGVTLQKIKDGYEVNIYLVVAYGIKITEVILEVQKKVAYTLNKAFKMPFKKVNVYVHDIKEIN